MAGGNTNTSSVKLILLLLVFSYLTTSMNAVPITRTRGLMHAAHTPYTLINAQSENVIDKRREIVSIKRRINVELNDYPGSGANNRHTPKPQVGRICVDC